MNQPVMFYLDVAGNPITVGDIITYESKGRMNIAKITGLVYKRSRYDSTPRLGVKVTKIDERHWRGNDRTYFQNVYLTSVYKHIKITSWNNPKIDDLAKK
jgi:hypothetical protein